MTYIKVTKILNLRTEKITGNRISSLVIKYSGNKLKLIFSSFYLILTIFCFVLKGKFIFISVSPQETNSFILLLMFNDIKICEIGRVFTQFTAKFKIKIDYVTNLIVQHWYIYYF